MSCKYLTMLGTAVCLLVFGSLIRCATSGAFLSVRFLTFWNPGGRGSNGHCCDGKYFFCMSQCDHSFTICLDRSDGQSRSVSQCSFGKTVSGEIREANHITFGNWIGSIANPVVWRIDSWPGRARLKIDIVDVDNNRNDDVDFLQTVLTLSPTTGGNRIHLTLKNRVQLAIDAQLYCGHHYYGLTCAVNCVPTNDSTGHYTCNTQDGSKICLTGWVGSECNTNKDDCIGNKCQNGGHCKDLTNSYECICPTGFTGNRCEQDVNECVSHDICGHGSCINQPGSYMCKCIPGYTGDTCSININDCLHSPCLNGATCHDLVDDFLCSCPTGFTGKLCDQDINECQHSPCSNNGTCVNYAGGYRCDCPSGYHGNDCSLDVDECNNSPCENEGVCTNSQGGYSCQCPVGFEGLHCEIDIDECEHSNRMCHNDGLCINTPGNYTCECVKGFAGQHCETNVNECLSDPCQHNATCHDLIGHYSCDCREGYTGHNCEHNINECLDGVCKNGGTCADLEGNFTCTCSAFWEGKTCEKNINECLSLPCNNGGTCENVQEGFHCICPTGFIGTLCEADMNECEFDNTCQNNATCTNRVGSFTCVCVEGWTGLRCQEDINECQLGHCNNLGTCVNTQGGFKCECPINWQGTRCQDDVNECAAPTLPCRNNATCHNIHGAFHCECAEGWTGPLCDVDINECMQVPDICKTIGNNADLDNFTDYHTLCTNTKPGYRCTCQEGWTGPLCNEDIDECVQSPNICETLGNFTDSGNSTVYHTLCTNTKPGYHCTCQKGWTGPLCNEDINECVQSPNICETLGNFTNQANSTDYHTLCTNKKPGYQCTCQEGWTGPLCNEDINECVQSPDICKPIDNFTDSGHSTDYHTLCTNKKPGYHCTCQEGWTGPLCNEDINECIQSPNICETLGNFTNQSNSTDYHTLCTNTKPGYHCTCQEGWTGPLCNEDINECVQSPDICNAEFIPASPENTTNYHTLCVNSVPGYVCMCQEGWAGELCDEDIDECLENPFLCSLLDNSTDNLPVGNYHTACVNTNPGFLCTCSEGWAGENCDKDIGATEVSISERNTTEITRETSLNTEISDVTTQVYSRNSKLPVNESSTTDDTAGSMQENHNITRENPDISIPLYLACTIKPSMDWTVNNGLKQVFLDTHLFEGKELTVSHRSQAETFKNGQTATSIYPTVTVNGKKLSDPEINFVLNKEPHKVQDYLHCPLILDAAQRKVAFSTSYANYSTTVWYPGLITACACLVVAVLMIVIVKSRRRMKTWILDKFQGLKPELSVMNPVYIPASGVQEETEEESDFNQFWAMTDNKLNSAAEYGVTHGQQERTD